MAKKTVKDLRKPSNSMLGDEVDRHESYGMVSASVISCGGVTLFGSEITHNSMIEIKLNRARRGRDGYTEFYLSGGSSDE